MSSLTFSSHSRPQYANTAGYVVVAKDVKDKVLHIHQDYCDLQGNEFRGDPVVWEVIFGGFEQDDEAVNGQEGTSQGHDNDVHVRAAGRLQEQENKLLTLETHESRGVLLQQRTILCVCVCAQHKE